MDKTSKLKALKARKETLENELKEIGEQLELLESYARITATQRKKPFCDLPLTVQMYIYSVNREAYNWFINSGTTELLTAIMPNLKKSIEDYENLGSPCGTISYINDD